MYVAMCMWVVVFFFPHETQHFPCPQKDINHPPQIPMFLSDLNLAVPTVLQQLSSSGPGVHCPQPPRNSPGKAQVPKVQTESQCSRSASCEEVLGGSGVSWNRHDQSSSMSSFSLVQALWPDYRLRSCCLFLTPGSGRTWPHPLLQ